MWANQYSYFRLELQNWRQIFFWVPLQSREVVYFMNTFPPEPRVVRASNPSSVYSPDSTLITVMS